MPRIIQIKGTQCSGKTWAQETIKDNPNVKIFDILDFYNKHKCIINEKMDWQKWETCIDQLPQELEDFISAAGKKLIIIEHSNNRHINKILSKYDVETLELKVPDKETIIERAKQRNLSAEKVLEFRKTYIRKYAGADIMTISSEMARNFLEEKVKDFKKKVNE